MLLLCWHRPVNREPPCRKPYHLTRGRPADREALPQLKQAWWVLWSGLLEPRHFPPGGLTNHWPVEKEQIPTTLHDNRQQTETDIRIVTVFRIKAVLTWLAGWVTGGGCLDSTEGSVSPFV